MNNEKTMSFANFNITFGQDEEPMLSHFEDVIFPAFCGNYKHGKQDEFPQFSCESIEIKEIDNEFVLVGNYIKDTQYSVRTTIQDGKLTSSPSDVPTAPYSRFIIFLKNHRMVLVKNESLSPDIRSFQKTMRKILSQYIHAENRKRDIKLPEPMVNIVDMPLRENIEQVLKNVDKIIWIRFRFFPLNNDLNPLSFANAIDDEMKKVGSKTANATFNSPKSKPEIKSMMEKSSGLAVATLNVIDEAGNTTKIKEDAFTSNKKIQFGRDVSASDDEYLINQAKKDSVITITSEENAALYERFIGMIKRLRN
jgi:hypothetical protein